MSTEEQTTIEAIKKLLLESEKRLSNTLEERLTRTLEERLYQKITAANKELQVELRLRILDLEQRLLKQYDALQAKFMQSESRVITAIDPLLRELETRREDRELQTHQLKRITKTN